MIEKDSHVREVTNQFDRLGRSVVKNIYFDTIYAKMLCIIKITCDTK